MGHSSEATCSTGSFILQKPARRGAGGRRRQPTPVLIRPRGTTPARPVFAAGVQCLFLKMAMPTQAITASTITPEGLPLRTTAITPPSIARTATPPTSRSIHRITSLRVGRLKRKTGQNYFIICIHSVLCAVCCFYWLFPGSASGANGQVEFQFAA